jgi:hypothetical protein
MRQIDRIPRVVASRDDGRHQESLEMEPKNDLAKKEKGPPTPLMVLVMSLLGYPGVGHLMVGMKKLGIGIIVVFTGLTLGVIYEMFAIGAPIVRAYSTGIPPEISVNWARVAFWVISTGVVWIGSGLHAMAIAGSRKKASPDAPAVSVGDS